MKALILGFIFAAGLCLGMALPLTRHLDDVDHAMAGVVVLCATAGFFIGGAVALIGMNHSSTQPLPDHCMGSRKDQD